ncbi:MAG: FtsX-like permease family protein, partial [Alphaproteobacteria bacterium]
ATLYGLLVTLIFTAWPLGLARDLPAARLFRKVVAPPQRLPRPAYLVLAAAATAGILVAAIALSEQRMLTAGFAAAAVLALALLRATGWALQRIAARLPRPRRPGLRLAIANLYRPGAATGPVVVSLGLGLTLFAALALVEGNMSREVAEQIPDRAPAFFFIDIQPHQRDEFIATAKGLPGVTNLVTVPSLRGTITRIKGVPAAEVKADPGSAWVLRGDRGLSYATEVPAGNALVAGQWWPPDYDGPPLVSMSAEEARGLGLDVGDSITVSVLGREITATVASLRQVEWGTFGFNFVILFDPHTLAAAPHGYMATLEASGEAEAGAYRALTDRFPNVTAVRMKEVLGSVNAILERIGAAVRATALITILAGILVLAGALAAGHRHRLYDAAVFKILGATRRTVLGAFGIECVLLGFLTGIVGLLLGGLAGWVVVTRVMELDFTPLPGSMVLVVLLSTLLTLAFGLLATWSALAARPAAVLRSA